MESSDQAKIVNETEMIIDPVEDTDIASVDMPGFMFGRREGRK